MHVLKILGILGLVVAGLVVTGIAMVYFSSSSLQSDARATHDSFKAGSSVFSFRVPDGVRMVMISFYTADEAKDCGGAMLSRETLTINGEPATRVALTDRSALGARLQASKPGFQRCGRMDLTLFGSTPQRATIKVHYKDGVVTRVEDPRLWD
jgi:hypothetical protein